jgi:rRNA-processing protein FCF1
MERRPAMSTLELTPDEGKALLEFLERYLSNLRIEIVNTEDREFRRSLRQREDIIRIIAGRLKEKGI